MWRDIIGWKNLDIRKIRRKEEIGLRGLDKKGRGVDKSEKGDLGKKIGLKKIEIKKKVESWIKVLRIEWGEIMKIEKIEKFENKWIKVMCKLKG